MGLLATVYRIAAGFIRPLKAGDGLRLYGSTSGYVGLAPAAAAGSVDYTLPSSAPASDGYVLSCTVAGVTSWIAAGGGSAAWESTSGVFQAKTSSIASGDQFYVRSRETDGATQVAHVLDTENSFTTAGGKLVSIRNNTTEQAYHDLYGNMVVVGQNLGGNGYRASMIVNGVTLDNQGSSANLYGLRVRCSAGIGQTDYETFRSVYGIVSVADIGSVGDSAFKVKARSSANPYTLSGYFLDATQYYDGDSYLNKTATTDGEMRWFYDGVKALGWSDKTTTTDNTITTIFNETMSDNTVHVIEVLIVGRRTDAAGRWSGRRRVTVYRAGGGATVEGVAETLGTDVANGITPTITLDTNSNDWRIRVTGETGKTIAWRLFVEKVHV